MNLDTKVTMGLKPISGKDFSVSQLVTTQNCPFSSPSSGQFPPYKSRSIGFPILNSQDHVAVCTNSNLIGSSRTLPHNSSCPSFGLKEKPTKVTSPSYSSFPNESKFSHNFVKIDDKYEKNFQSLQFQAPDFSGSVTLNKILQPPVTKLQVKSPTVAVYQTGNSNHEAHDSKQHAISPQRISAFVPGEFVFYENNQSESSDSALFEKPFSGYNTDLEVSREVEKAAESHYELNSSESLGPAKKSFPEDKLCDTRKNPEKYTTISSILDTTPSSVAEFGNILNSNPSKQLVSSHDENLLTESSGAKNPPESPPKRKSHAFKKLTPTTVIEKFLSGSKDMSYEELYRRTEAIAFLMTQLQDEARIIDKELHDFEVARKYEQQIAAEQLRLEKEKQQKRDDEIFGMLLKKYGSFARSSAGEWTNFHNKFYKDNFERNPHHCQIALFLRNPQYISEFHKRISAKIRAELRAGTCRLANTVDSPPTKTEQKATEDSDRKKRKPAIDPLIFDDRKMADVYGLSYKAGEAFIGNQPLKDRNEGLKKINSLGAEDENCRPKRTRGKRGNCDSDHSDNTPAASDIDDNLRTKRVRTKKVVDNKTVSTSKSKTASPSRSRESTPLTGPKVFASGKRIGRPPGSKTQVKLPSKLKSVQAVGEVKEVKQDVG